MAESPLFSPSSRRREDVDRANRRQLRHRRAMEGVFHRVARCDCGGQAVVWYTGQFYALIFLQTTLKVPLDTAYKIVALALLLGTPFFVVFGALSDRIGRKGIIMAGC
jgi:hypothetical protein